MSTSGTSTSIDSRRPTPEGALRIACVATFLVLFTIPWWAGQSRGGSFEELLAPLAVGARTEDATFRSLTRTASGDARLGFVVRTESQEGRVTLLVMPRGRVEGRENTPSFTVDWAVDSTDVPTERARALRRAVAAVIRANDPGGLELASMPMRRGERRAFSIVAATSMAGMRGWLSASFLVALAWFVVTGRRVACLAAGLLLSAHVAVQWGWSARLVAPYVPLTLVGPAALLVLVATDPSPTTVRRDALLLAGLALGLRVGFGAFAPVRVNGLGPMWIHGAYDMLDALRHYGPGYREWLGPLTRLPMAAPDTSIFVANACLGASIAGTTSLAAHHLGLPSQARTLVGVLLAVLPLAVRFSASEGYWVPIAASVSGGLLAVTRIANREASAAPPLVRDLVVVAVLLASAVRIHPMGWPALALTPVVALAVPRGAWPSRLAMTLCIALVSAAAVVATSSEVLADVLIGIEQEALARPSTRLSGAVPTMLAALAIAHRIRRFEHARLVAVAAVAVAVWLTLRPTYGQSALWQGCFDQAFVALPCLAAASVAASASARVVLVVLALAQGIAAVSASPTTEQLEYRLLRRHLAHVAAPCSVLYVRQAEREALWLPGYVRGAGEAARLVPLERWDDGLSERLRHGCWVYVHTSLCSRREGAGRCRDVESRLPARTVMSSTRLPARPSVDREPYLTSDVPISVERLDPRVGR